MTSRPDQARRRPSGGPSMWTGVLLGTRFLTELALLAALAAVGIAIGSRSGLLMQVGLAVLLPAVAVVVWGAFVAPKAQRRLADPTRLAVELALFVVSAAALGLVGDPVLAVVYGVVAVASAVLVRRVAPGS